MADESGGCADEGKDVLGLAFIAAVWATASAKPGNRTFDDPSMTAEPLQGLDALAGGAVAYAAAAEPSSWTLHLGGRHHPPEQSPQLVRYQPLNRNRYASFQRAIGP